VSKPVPKSYPQMPQINPTITNVPIPTLPPIAPIAPVIGPGANTPNHQPGAPTR
jgi:hypothetical protein